MYFSIVSGSLVIAEARGSGLLMGLKCAVQNTELVTALRHEHLLSVGAGENVVRLLPPLTVTVAEAREALSRIEAAAASLMPVSARKSA